MLKFRLLVSFMVNESPISKHRRHIAQRNVTPEEASEVTEEKEISDLIIQIKNVNCRFA